MLTPDRPEGGAEKAQWNQSASEKTPVTALNRRKCFIQSLISDHLVLVPFLSFLIRIFSLFFPFFDSISVTPLGPSPPCFLFSLSAFRALELQLWLSCDTSFFQHPHGALIFRLHRSFLFKN